MKKLSKPTATPAPASPRANTPAPAPAAAPALKKPAAAPAAAPAPAAVKKPAVRAQPAPAKVNPPTASAPVAASAEKIEVANVTSITAKIDIGFGNALYIRGEGPGLSWNKGLPLKNTGSDSWTIALPKSTRPIVFKFLLNDDTWSTGSDYSADPGATATYTPSF